MIDNGMKPSDAVSCGVADYQLSRLTQYLGVRSIQDLDRMNEASLRRLFGPAALATV